MLALCPQSWDITGYVDLALIRWPNEDHPLPETLEALQTTKERGRLSLLGVSNFTPALVDRALKIAPVCCHLVEYSPLLDQGELLEHARDHGLVLTSRSPLVQGKVLDEAPVKQVVDRVGRQPSQVDLRWHMQQDGVAEIPRLSREDHLRETLEVFGFSFSEEELRTISATARGKRQIDPPWAAGWDQ